MTDPPDLPNELLTVGQVCKRLPGARGNCRTSPATVTRWVIAGCPSVAGERVKLRATRAGGRWLIAEGDLQAFFSALAEPGPTTSPAAVAKRTSDQRGRAARAAARELERRGA